MLTDEQLAELREKYQRQEKELEDLEMRIFKLRNEMTVTSGRIELAVLRRERAREFR